MSRDLFLAGGGNTTKMYDIPLEKFEVSYIEGATDVKELEKILKVLRSGSEGSFPHLEDAAEKRLTAIDPENRTLRKSAAIGTRGDLAPESRDRLTNDINDFLDDISNVDQQLRKRPPGGAGKQEVPIRAGGVSINKENVKSNKSPKPKDYREWEKIERGLNPDEEPVTEQKPAPARKCGIDTQVDVSGKSELEKQRMAEMEKDKGNEYFTAGDYDTAIVYYTRSINIIPSPAAYNNRALVHLKREHYDKCISDCQAVLEVDPGNIKALLRRGSSYKAQTQYNKAKRDFAHVLLVEPQNLRAEKLLNETVQDWRTKGKKLVIDEVDSLEDEKPSTDQNGHGETKVNGNVVNERVNGLNNESEKETVKSKPSETKTESEKPKPRRIVIEESDSDDDFQDAETELKPEVKTETKVKENEEGATEESSDAASVKTASTDVSSDSDPANSTDTSPLHQPQPPRPPTPPPQRPIFRTLPLPDHLAALKEQGNNAFRNGQHTQALDLYTRIITDVANLHDQEVNLSTLYTNRATAHSKLGDCRAAIEDCNRSLQCVPHGVKALVRRAFAYETLEKYKDAYRDFKHALAVDAGMEQAQQGLSRCRDVLYRDLGKQWRTKVPETVVNSYEIPLIVPLGGAVTQTTAPSPITPTAPLAPSTVSKNETAADEPPPLEDAPPTLKSVPTKTKTESKTQPKAEPKPAKSESKPATPKLDKEEEHDAVKSLGNTHVGKGQYKEAIDCYTLCLTMFQDRSAIYTNRALCYLKVNKPDEAIQDCDKALELDQSNVKAWFRRAQARKMNDDLRNCMGDLLQVLRIDSNNTAAKKELEVVKKAYQETFAKEQEERKKDSGSSKKKSKKEQKHQQPQPQPQKTSPQPQQQQQQQQPSSGKKKKKPVIEVVSETPASDTTTESKPAQTKQPQASTKKESKKSKKNAKQAETTPPPQPPVVETPTIPKISNPESPFEFMQAWHSLKGSKEVASYAGLLDQIQPRHLRKLLGNKLDSEILTTVLRTIHEHTLKTDLVRSYHLLHHLRHVERFDMATMFMNNLDKVIVREALEHMAGDSKCPGTKTDLASLRKAYKI